MAYGFQYNPAGSKCSGKAQPGVRILRDTMDDLVPELGDLGIYNCRPTRGGGSLSLHGEGRAWDCAASGALLIKAGQFFVDAAEMLGVQRVICGFGPGKAPKEWDSRPGQRFWSDYGGPAHDDHDHVELCWDAALHLTVQQVKDAFGRYWVGAEEDFLAKLTEDEQQELLEKVRRIDTAIIEKDDAKVKAVTGRSTGSVMSGIWKLLKP